MYMVRIFMKCTHVCAAQITYLLFNNLSIEPDFPSLAGKVAKPRQVMNIKVSACTVSERFIYTMIIRIPAYQINKECDFGVSAGFLSNCVDIYLVVIHLISN